MPHLKPFKIRLSDDVTVATWFDQPVQQRALRKATGYRTLELQY